MKFSPIALTAVALSSCVQTVATNAAVQSNENDEDKKLYTDWGTTKAEDIKGQTEQVCKNIKAVLEAAGSSLEKVVKTVCFLKDMGDFAAFNEVYARYFVSKPARSCVAVKDLPKGVLSKVDQDASISVLFSLDMGRYNIGDCNLVYITAITDGVENEQEVSVVMDVVKTFGTFEVQFDNVTRDTEFAIETKVQTDARSIRIYFDNFKITKL